MYMDYVDPKVFWRKIFHFKEEMFLTRLSVEEMFIDPFNLTIGTNCFEVIRLLERWVGLDTGQILVKNWLDFKCTLSDWMTSHFFGGKSGLAWVAILKIRVKFWEQLRGAKAPLGDYRCTCFRLGLCSKVLSGHWRLGVGVGGLVNAGIWHGLSPELGIEPGGFWGLMRMQGSTQWSRVWKKELLSSFLTR